MNFRSDTIVLVAPAFPFFKVLSYETELSVCVVVWHVRSVRAIRELAEDSETITRIEFSNGDVLDTSDSVEDVLDRMRRALAPVTECILTTWRFMEERTERRHE
jgi:hypothetical protein